jgi:hypothetical protein
MSSCAGSPLRQIADELRDVHGVINRRLIALEQEKQARAQRKGGLSGWLHGALDVVGLVPVFGEVADGANALWYLAEGDLVNAALSSAALLPIGGQFATASKYADEAIALADDAVALADDAVALADDAVDLADEGFSSIPGTWGRPDTLTRHVRDHAADFGVTTAEEYELAASEFFVSSQQRGLPTKVDSGGRIRTYDPDTNTFGAYNPDGTVATFYKPDPAVHGEASNWDYWLTQDGDPPWTTS